MGTLLVSSEDEAAQGGVGADCERVGLQRQDPFPDGLGEEREAELRPQRFSLLERIRRRQSHRHSSRRGEEIQAPVPDDDDGGAAIAPTRQPSPRSPQLPPPAPNVECTSVACPPSASDMGRSDRLHPELLGDEALKAWMAFFGMKPAGSREFMIRKLREIDTYLSEAHVSDTVGSGEPRDSTSSGDKIGQCRALVPTTVSSRASPKRRGRPKKRPRKDEGAASSSGMEATSTADTVCANQAARQACTGTGVVPLSQFAWEGAYQDQAEVRGGSGKAAKAAAKAAHLEELVAEVIRGDTELYERLLLFEPVEIGELRDRLAAVRPELGSLGEQRLRKFLDSQGLLSANAWSQQGPAHGRRRF